MSTLHLVVCQKAYEVMEGGEKRVEFRRVCEWIRSRLYWEDGREKTYKKIRFSLGYGGQSFSATFLGFKLVRNVDREYSNGLRVVIKETPTYAIKFKKR